MSNQDISLMAHLMRRAGFGATPAELEAKTKQGYDATVEVCSTRTPRQGWSTTCFGATTRTTRADSEWLA